MAGQPKLLFVVEDDTNVLLMTSMILQRLGFSVKKFTTGEDALDALGVQRPFAVLCDFNLPGDNGIQVLTKVRDREPEVFRVLVTGNTGAEPIQAGLDDAAAQVLLEKPFSIKSLCHALFMVARGTTGRVFRYQH